MVLILEGQSEDNIRDPTQRTGGGPDSLLKCSRYSLIQYRHNLMDCHPILRIRSVDLDI